MKLLLSSCSIFLTILSNAWSQSQMPVIRANDAMVDIRQGDVFQTDQWRIVPEAKPDILISNKAGEKVTFYTDLDSISYVVHPDSVYDFIILFNGKDSAYTQIKYEPSYLDILKKAGTYDQDDVATVPNFTYQDSSAAPLQTLRKTFHLDSIAGTGNDVSQILNLMHWIHALIPHDGQHNNPEILNASSLIRQCAAENRGLNCRGLAITLNECYLALGFKSRYVTCMPRDSVFNDCHVINMVFAESLDKWIWVDPTNDAYVMNETGKLLDLAEVRERLINDQMLILNPDANWNKKSSTVKEYYLEEYMAKNLYRFSCPLYSQYNTETMEKGKNIEFVELIPLDGLNQRPKYNEVSNERLGVKFITYKTNNPDLFWAKPGK